MKISIDGQEYAVQDDQVALLLTMVQSTGLDMYQQQPDWLRFGLKPLARGLLDKWEGNLAKILGKERAASICRPGKRQDPVPHLANLAMLQFQAMLKYAKLTIETDGENTTAFNISFPAENQAGRSMVANGDIWLRQNDGPQIPGRGLHAPVSNDAPLPP